MRKRFKSILVGALLLALLVQSGAAQVKPSEVFTQYSLWQHSGSLYILTTPAGADLPATDYASSKP